MPFEARRFAAPRAEVERCGRRGLRRDDRRHRADARAGERVARRERDIHSPATRASANACSDSPPSSKSRRRRPQLRPPASPEARACARQVARRRVCSRQRRPQPLPGAVAGASPLVHRAIGPAARRQGCRPPRPRAAASEHRERVARQVVARGPAATILASPQGVFPEPAVAGRRSARATRCARNATPGSRGARRPPTGAQTAPGSSAGMRRPCGGRPQTTVRGGPRAPGRPLLRRRCAPPTSTVSGAMRRRPRAARAARPRASSSERHRQRHLAASKQWPPSRYGPRGGRATELRDVRRRHCLDRPVRRRFVLDARVGERVDRARMIARAGHCHARGASDPPTARRRRRLPLRTTWRGAASRRAARRSWVAALERCSGGRPPSRAPSISAASAAIVGSARELGVLVRVSKSRWIACWICGSPRSSRRRGRRSRRRRRPADAERLLPQQRSAVSTGVDGAR